jgi:tetratricopeptide (TPR) repeat protein
MELYPILNKITQQQIDAYSSYLYGCSLKSCGKYSGALMMFGKASAQDPTNPHYPLAEAEMHLKASDLPAAEACLNKRLAIGPTAEGRWIAAFLAAADSRIEEALQKAEPAFAEDDRPTLKCYAYAALLSKLGRHKEAQEQIDRLIEQEPDFWEYRVHKADCYLASEEFDKAEECMNLAMNLCCADQSLYAKRLKSRKNGEPESLRKIGWMRSVWQPNEPILSIRSCTFCIAFPG